MQSIRWKIMVTSFLICLFAIGCIVGYDLYVSVREADDNVKAYRTMLMDQFDRGLKNEVDTVVSLVNGIYQQQTSGQLTEAEAKKRAADLVRGLRFDKDNYFWVDNYNGVNVVLLGRDQEGKSRWEAKDKKDSLFIQGLITNGQKEGGGYTEYWFPKPNQTEALLKRAYTAAFQPYQWVIGAGNWIDDIDKIVKQKEIEYQKTLRQGLMVKGGITVLVLLIACMASFYFGNSMATPIARVTNQVNQMSAGNFQVQSAPEDLIRQDELGIMARGVQGMSENLGSLIRQIAGTAGRVADTSDQLSAAAQQSAQASYQVAETVTNMAGGASRQVAAVNETGTVVHEITAVMEHVASTANLLAGMAEQTAGRTNDGQRSVEKAVQQINTVGQNTETTAAAIDNLRDSSSRIGEIVAMISSIAGQTNLLALNAAIEAARAGEMGRGFAVVAEEVRKLAEQSETAAQQIAEMIRNNHEQISSTVTRMDTAKTDVVNGVQLVNNAGRDFVEIARMVKELSSEVSGISASLQEMAAGSQRIVGSVNLIEQESKKGLGDAETIAAATEQQSASADEIATSSQSLAKLAEELQMAVSRFKV